MRIDKQIHPTARHLVLCFNGWSASPALFQRLEMETEKEKENTDICICYDYRDLSFDEELKRYDSIRIIAWSLGVWVADYLFSHSLAPYRSAVTAAIAINGTGRPIDDRYGIPETIFEGTLQHLTPDGIERFTRRMCGNRHILAEYSQLPRRPLDEIAAELQYLYQEVKNEAVSDVLSASSIPWSRAIISTHDCIFPPDNLRRYWQDRCPVCEIDAPHYPFYLWKKWNDLWKL